jgi:hypothetical protein
MAAGAGRGPDSGDVCSQGNDPLVTPFRQANFYRNDWQLRFVMTLSPEPYAGYSIDLHQPADRSMRSETEEAEMKLSIASSALLIAGFVAASTEYAGAVVYCQYIEYPAGCVVRPGVVIAPPTHGVRKIPPSIAPTRGFIITQDLIDRNNPNNLRSDWPSPSGLPGQ